MTFWDAGIGSLEALGVQVSPEQIMVLEQGGEILALQGLLSPISNEGDNTGITDQFGEQVYVPTIFIASPPTSRLEPAWKQGTITLSKYLEGIYGYVWRTWPSYVGVFTSVVDERAHHDELSWIRVWDGHPIMDDWDKALARQIFRAAQRRLADSLYEQMCLICDFESSGEVDEEGLLAVATGSDADIKALGYFDWNSDYIQSVAEAYRELIAGKYLCLPTASVQEFDSLKDLQFRPMSDYLSGSALILWRAMVVARETAITKIRNALPEADRSSFIRTERDFS